MTVVNVGKRGADEVLQLYLEPPGRAVERPARLLVGFQRLTLAVAESRRVELTIPLRRLAYFDETLDAFVLEAGRHRLRLARHAEAEGLIVELELEATRLGV